MATWPKITIQDWYHFQRVLEELTSRSPAHAGYVFRGQARSWPVESTLRRCVPPHTPIKPALAIELAATQEFQKAAHLYLSTNVQSFLHKEPALVNWWTIMQHYSAPTRLIDWTQSPWVALYFACVDEWNVDGEIWMFDGDAVTAKMKEKHEHKYSEDYEEFETIFRSEDPPNDLYLIFPTWATDRQLIQQGLFTMSRRLFGNHTEAIAEALESENVEFSHTRVVIPSGLKSLFMSNLRSMNIGAHSLFPGLDGLGRRVTEVAKIVTSYPLKSDYNG